jgi:zinc transport system ATP-binding protein
MTKPIAVSFDHVSVKYDGVIALEDINFDIEEGDYVGIIGPNGGGKTTILKAILDLVQPFAGTVAVFGQPPQKMRQAIGYVPQVAQFERYFPIDVMDVVLMGRLNKSGLFKRYSKLDREKAIESLGYVGLADQRRRQLGKLSGGQIQRVMVARALASDPQILLLDEPTASVDYQAEQNLYELLGKLNEEMTIILVSHDIGVVSSHVKSLACLNRRLFHHGSKEILPEVIEKVYGCPVDIIAHSATPHRVLPSHPHEEPYDA